MTSRVMKAVCAVGALVFLASVAVQYNDPDPLRWMAIYGAAAAVCILGLRGRLWWPAPAAVALIGLVWAATLEPRVWGKVHFGEMFESFQMHDVRVEQGREMGGLLIVVAWMLVLLAFHRRR